MKIKIIIIFLTFLINSLYAKPGFNSVITNALKNATEQSLLMARSLENDSEKLPRSFVNEKLTTSDSGWWCSGFYPGVLWYLYEADNNPNILRYAREYTARVEGEKYNIDNHDVGFMIFCSFGNGYRLTGDLSYKEVIKTASTSLATRYSDKVGLIRSWDFNKANWQYPVIIDNLMNLEMLMWTSKTFNNKRLCDISISHADKTLKHHYRTDASCYHVVSYDTITGVPHKKQTWQGYSDYSSWSRGQGWGLYSYTFMYRETKVVRYLDMAKKIAAYLIHHPRMPKDYIPYWDFDAPGIPNEPRDASAAALMASALIELSDFVEKPLSKRYLEVAEMQIRTLASPNYTATLGENGNFILKHSVGHMPEKSEVDVPLTYADYYYVEALVRMKKKMTHNSNLNRR